jgi:uncharacterized protein YbjT (DUF2867 family)
MDKGKTLLLLGATGLVGGHCLAYLLNDHYYADVTILTRRLLPVAAGRVRIRQHLADFDRLDYYREQIRGNDVICALGSTIKKAGSKEAFHRVDFDYPYETARIAYENGAQHFLLVSAAGADPGSPFFYSRVKGDLENAVMGLGYQRVSIFRPSLLLGKRKEFRAGELFLQMTLGPLSFAVPEKYRPIPAQTVAAAMLQTARNDSAGIRIFESTAIRGLGQEYHVL